VDSPTGRIDELLLQAGDAVTFLSQGGGGLGDPLARDPEAVGWDVRRGLVSVQAARDAYGVAVQDGVIDAAETRTLRAARMASPPSAFAFGAERDEYEATWTDELQLALSRAMQGFTASRRGYLRVAVMREAERRLRAGQPLNAGGLAELLQELAGNLATPARSASRVRR
jgi:N-methylhydantoinase B